MRARRWVEWRGERVTLIDLAEGHDINLSTLRSRLARGMDLSAALSDPILSLEQRQRRGREVLLRSYRNPSTWRR